jgi:hypothetical protein
MHRTLPAVLALVLLCTPLHAQPAPTVQPGDRIRLNVPEAFRDPVIGTVVESSAGTLTLARSDGGRADTVNIPVVMIRSADISRGQFSRGSSVGRGAVIGLGTGVMVGAVFGGVQALGADEFGGSGVDEVSTSAKFALRFGALGLAAGAIFGLRGRERWESLALPDVRVGVRGQAPSVTVSLKL